MQTTCFIFLVFPLIAIPGCTVPLPPVTPDLCQDGVVRIDLLSTEQSANGNVAIKRSGFDGVDCNILEQPLAAVNWYTYPTNLADIDSIAAYQAGMVPILRGYGTRLLFVGNETELLF